MAAGGPGDHPLSDILNFDHLVYNEKCDALVKELSKYLSNHDLYLMFDWFEPQLADFEIRLSKKLEELSNSDSKL